MQSYNANAERKIEELIREAVEDADIFHANEILIKAVDILNRGFNSYIHDSPEYSIKRIASKQRLQANILEAYRSIILNIPSEDYFSDIESELKKI